MNVEERNRVKKQSITTKVNGNASKSKKSVTIINHNKLTLGDHLTVENPPNSHPLRHSTGDIELNGKYVAPELNTMLGLTKRLQDLKIVGRERLRDFNDMTPRTKSIATEEALKKLNFVRDRPVYRNLAPVNVNDSVLEVMPRSSGVRRPKSRDPLAINKDSEPNLSDYLTSIESSKHKHQIHFNDIDSDDDDEPLIRTRHFNNNYVGLYQFYEKHLCK